MKIKACWNEIINGVEYLVTEDGEIRRQLKDDRRPSSSVFVCMRHIDTSKQLHLTSILESLSPPWYYGARK